MNAFPNQGHTLDSLKDMNGMDLRDYFAAKAMQAIIGLCYREFDIDNDKNDVSEDAYAIAEAMLMEREK
jgi:hypothetical protein